MEAQARVLWTRRGGSLQFAGFDGEATLPVFRPSSLPANRAFFLLRAIARSFCPCRLNVEVDYPWHRLYGRRLWWRYSEQRVAGQVVHVEAIPSVFTAIAAWMLYPVACAGMAAIGVRRVAISALFDLSFIIC